MTPPRSTTFHSEMPSLLVVPNGNLQNRRCSDSHIGRAVSDYNLFRNKKTPTKEKEKKPFEKSDKNSLLRAAIDYNLIEVLRKNYDIVSALADIDNEGDTDSLTTGDRMVRSDLVGDSRESPRPLVLRNHNPYRFNQKAESTSISSQEDDDLAITRSTTWSQISSEARLWWEEILDALQTPCPHAQNERASSSRLSVAALKRDIGRCLSASRPFLECGAALRDVVLWKSPLNTLILMLIYMYAVVQGYALTLFLLLIWVQLSLNFLKEKRNIDIGWSFLPRKEVSMPKFDLSGAQLIFQIAKFAQQMLKFTADFLEKLHSLFVWKQAKVTKRFYFLLCYWIALSVIFNTGTCVGMCALTLGIRIFITMYLFDRFPRLRRSLDTFGYFYRNLPIKERVPSPNQSPNLNIKIEDGKLKPTSSFPGELSRMSHRRSFCCGDSSLAYQRSCNDLPSSNNNKLCGKLSLDSAEEEAENASISFPVTPAESIQAICPQSSTEESENENDVDDSVSDPIADDAIMSRRCVMNDKERRFPKALLSGTLYLTEAALLFKCKHNSRTLILFEDILQVKKFSSLRTLSLTAEARKSIELIVEGRKRPIYFIGLADRDSFVFRLQSACEAKCSPTRFLTQK